MVHGASTEQVRLRRADWRFLLPNPRDGSFRHLVLLGGSAGLAERIGEVGLARRVSCEVLREQAADALVILRDAQVGRNAQVVLKDAARSLVPGGSLYCEIDRRSLASLASTPGGIRSSLEAAGLTPTGSYWAKPNFTRCEMYLPLDVQGAFAWYLTTIYTAVTPLRLFLETGLRIFTGLQSRRFARLAPCYAVTAIAGPCQSAAPSVLGHPAFPTELREPNLRLLMLAGGGDDRSRVIMLLFTSSGTQPTVVVKVPRLSDFNSHTEREQAVLAEVRSCLGESMRRTLPRPLGIVRCGDLAVGIESYAPGRSLSTSIGRWCAPMDQKISDLRLVASWLGEFHRQAQIGRPRWGPSELSRWVERPLAAYRQAFGAAGNEERLFAGARECARALVGTPLPIVWQHHDFGEWNICCAGRELAVIDWERGRVGPALCDLIYFVTHWSYTARNLRGDVAQLRGFRELFLERNGGGAGVAAARQVLTRYLAHLDIDRRFLPLLLVCTWVEHALDRFHRQRALGEGGANVRSGNRYVAYIAILAGHAEWLFGGVGTES